MYFRYNAKTKNGQTQTGIYKANNEDNVIDFLHRNGWIPIDVKAAKYQGLSLLLRTLKNRISIKDKSIFYRHLSLMISSGIPIEKSLLILQEENRKHNLKYAIQQILTDVRNGAPLSASLERLENFSELEVAIIRSGEAAGLLDTTLQKLSELLAKRDSLRKKVIAASTYPMLVLFVAVSVLLLMTVFILPQFENTFYQMKIPMPAFSAAVFTTGKFIRRYWYAILFIPIICAVMLLCLKRQNAKFAEKLDKVKLKLPIFGNIIFESALSRSYRTLGLMLESGVDILSALSYSSEVAGNAMIKKDFNKMFEAAKTGKSLYNTLSGNHVYPALVAQIIKIGEETGKADDKFIELADIFENDMNDTISQLSSVLEPVLIIIIGILVAIMLFAVYMPILNAVRNFI